MKTKQQKKIIIQDSFERDIEKNKNRLPAFSKEKLPVTKEFTNKPGNFSALDLSCFLDMATKLLNKITKISHSWYNR